MANNTIREYLVALGFTVDEAKLHRFQDAISGTARSAAGLGAEVIGVGFALTEMVERVARHFEDLYYMSQRTGATVSGLDAIGFAARQVGLSSEQARSAVEGFADAMRMNPGLRGLAGGLLGHRDVDPERDLPALVKRLSAFPDFVAIRMAEQFGITSQVYLHLKNNMKELEQAEREHQRRMREAGVDLDRDKDRWVVFTRQVNDTSDAFRVMGDRIADDWRPAMQGLIRDVGSMAESFNRANSSSEGILGKITSLIAAFGGVTAIMALLGKLFGFKTGVGLKTLGAVGAPLMAAELMSDQNEKTATDLRTGLRALLGIEDPKEPLPWSKGGTWGVGTHEAPNPWFPLDIGNRSRPPVKGSKNVWGDKEAEDAGLYDPIVPMPRPRPSGGANINLHQTNNITGRNAEEIARRVSDSNREFGDALRNLSQKIV